jgi:hypothetical protein
VVESKGSCRFLEGGFEQMDYHSNFHSMYDITDLLKNSFGALWSILFACKQEIMS